MGKNCYLVLRVTNDYTPVRILLIDVKLFNGNGYCEVTFYRREATGG
ncbi:protein of unknown function [Legionella hackeliae]|uniref:Uncharacterized protein n=1 Tax=Legionella hackeliae TaxID=449 RepID=A0A0A8UW33_LEGHA|nr:protein of unknown function [Legionella hackeliae]